MGILSLRRCVDLGRKVYIDSYLFLSGFVNAYWHTTMPVGIVTDGWSGTRWPPSHLASGLPTAPSAEPCPHSGLHAFRSRMVPHSAFWNVGQGHGRETGCIQEPQRASPCRCPIGSILPGCFGNGCSWGKNALPARNSCVGFPLLSIVTYVIEVFAQLPAEMQVPPPSPQLCFLK